MMALILLQPVLDILSFWQDQAGADNTLTLALRFGMLLVVALAGFCLSGRKRIYVALALVLLGLWPVPCRRGDSGGFADTAR